MRSFLVPVLVIAAYSFAPVVLIIGWVHWSRRRQERRTLPMLSLASFVLGTASTFLAAGSQVYARAIGGFPYSDPRLMKIFQWGLYLSLAGLALSLVGIWKRSTLRWYAPALSCWMFLLWILWAMSEY